MYTHSELERGDNLCGFDLRATIFPRRIAVHIFSSLQADDDDDDGVGANRSNSIPQKLFSHRLNLHVRVGKILIYTLTALNALEVVNYLDLYPFL